MPLSLFQETTYSQCSHLILTLLSDGEKKAAVAGCLSRRVSCGGCLQAYMGAATEPQI